MRWFLAFCLLILIAVMLAPFWLLAEEDLSRFEGKVVTYGIYSAKVKSIDPVTTNDTTSLGIQGGIYEGLYAYHYLKRPPTLVPALAEALPEISKDGLVYTIKIKKDSKYSRNICFGKDADGRLKTRTVTAHDFVLAFKRTGDFHVSPAAALSEIEDRVIGITEYRKRTRSYAKGDFSRYDKEQIKGIRAIDDHTLQIRLSQPFPQLVYLFASTSFAPMPREVIDYHLATRDDGTGERKDIPMEERDTSIHSRQAVVGTGPYLLTEWTRGHRIIMERNPDHRVDLYPSEGEPGDKEAGLLEDAGKQLPFIDVRYLTCVQETNPAWMLFLSKQRDTSGIPPKAFDNVISPSRKLMDEWKEQGIRLVKSDYPAIYFLAFNMSDGVSGKSKSLRQAMCMAFDVEQYVKIIYNGRGKRSVNNIPSSFPGHKEAGPGPYYRYDIKAAKAKLLDAKKELIQAGIIGPNDPIPQLTVDLPGRDAFFMRLGEFVQGEFRKIGLIAKIELNDWPTLQAKVTNKQCQLYMMGGVADRPDADTFLMSFYSPNIKRGTNDTNYSNKEYDKLFEQASVLSRMDDRVPLYAEMAKILSEDCPLLLLTEPITYTLVYDWVYNFKPHLLGYGHYKHTRLDVKARYKAGGKR